MANENMKLPSRNYWDGFKARNEALWDKIRNNTFVNMVFPVQEVSEGNTEAILPLVIPGGNAVILATNTIGKKAVGEAAKSINTLPQPTLTISVLSSKTKYPFGRPNSMRRTEAIDGYLENRMNPQARASFEEAMLLDPALKEDTQLQKDIIFAIRRRGFKDMIKNIMAESNFKNGGAIDYFKFYK